ncbi:MAG: malic enzyme-like NAD(P)-binding protein [Pseudomonadota bacterium]
MSTLSFSEEALKYHREPSPGKLSIAITKSTESQQDLALAYTPGVARPVMEIANDPENAYLYTGKGNLVAVISNGPAVLGLGDVGALASKPVMEGKAVLFKRFADVDVFDIEIDCADPYDLIETIVRISPTFGGINLEDIKAPECFIVENELKKRLNIPVFHDDQHGTAIIVAAGLINALKLQQKKIEEVKIVCLGAGAAGIASMNLLIELGAKAENLYMVDRNGIIHSERNDLNEYKQPFALQTDKRTLMDAMHGADVFIGVSGANLVSEAMIAAMAPKPIIFALSNPDPEISPELAHRVRQDLIMATGRSDYPNQVNNVLGFPYIFRGALDVRAHTINIEMQIAAVHAISELAYEEVPAEVLAAYPLQTHLTFGPDYILPKPMDARLRTRVSAAVAKAAIDSGVTSSS